MVDEPQTRRANVPAALAGKRLDQALADLFPEFSRARLQQWLRDGAVRVDGRTGMRAKDRVLGGESIELVVELKEEGQWVAQAIDLDIVFEDEAIIVINKPPGIVVHPAAGNPDGTLLNALLHHAPELAQLPRAGIVHRLDKDTSGLMVVARTLAAHKSLVDQLQARSVSREYDALVYGELVAGGTVDAPLGRHPVDRKRRAVVVNGKEAITHYRVNERFPGMTLLRVMLETGRTHQIRVHMAHIRHPLVGDQVYGGRLTIPKGYGDRARAAVKDFRRQALHAACLRLTHPLTDRILEWKSVRPADFEHLLACLREDQR